jgi:hypothetical protein
MEATEVQAERPGRVRRGLNKLTRKIRPSKSADEPSTSTGHSLPGDTFPTIQEQPNREKPRPTMAIRAEQPQNEVPTTSPHAVTSDAASGTSQATTLKPESVKVSEVLGLVLPLQYWSIIP